MAMSRPPSRPKTAPANVNAHSFRDRDKKKERLFVVLRYIGIKVGEQGKRMQKGIDRNEQGGRGKYGGQIEGKKKHFSEANVLRWTRIDLEMLDSLLIRIAWDPRHSA
jgi:hypothetical protein